MVWLLSTHHKVSMKRVNEKFGNILLRNFKNCLRCPSSGIRRRAHTQPRWEGGRPTRGPRNTARFDRYASHGAENSQKFDEVFHFLKERKTETRERFEKIEFFSDRRNFIFSPESLSKVKSFKRKCFIIYKNSIFWRIAPLPFFWRVARKAAFGSRRACVSSPPRTPFPGISGPPYQVRTAKFGNWIFCF